MLNVSTVPEQDTDTKDASACLKIKINIRVNQNKSQVPSPLLPIAEPPLPTQEVEVHKTDLPHGLHLERSHQGGVTALLTGFTHFLIMQEL